MRRRLGLSALFVLLCCSTGCKTWKYVQDHRGIFPIACTSSNIPVGTVDLDSLRSEEQHSFGPGEKPAVVILGYTDKIKLKVLDLSTGKKIDSKRLQCDWNQATVQVLDIPKTGRYEIYFSNPNNPLTSRSCDISVTRTPKTIAETNAPRASLLEYSQLQLELIPKRSWKNYDAVFIASVERGWFDSLDNEPILKHGKVVLQFGLSSEGQISDLKVLKNASAASAVALCEKAVSNPAPYPAWPEELRKKVGAPTRNIQFTFYY
jgi:hypothetical protein